MIFSPPRRPAEGTFILIHIKPTWKGRRDRPRGLLSISPPAAPAEGTFISIHIKPTWKGRRHRPRGLLNRTGTCAWTPDSVVCTSLVAARLWAGTGGSREARVSNMRRQGADDAEFHRWYIWGDIKVPSARGAGGLKTNRFSASRTKKDEFCIQKSPWEWLNEVWG